jgi:F-type H+-transporting ATPase subunit epsilon
VAQLEVDLVSADGRVWSGPATMVCAPTVDGEIGILVGHQPILAVLRAGEVRVTPLDGPVMRGTVTGGYLSVDDDHVTVVADDAVVIVGPGTPTR